MSPTARIVRDHAIGAALGAGATIVSAVAVMTLTGVWNRKENTSDHNADIQRIEAARKQDATRLDDKLQRVLDVVCDTRVLPVTPRACEPDPRPAAVPPAEGFAPTATASVIRP